MSEDEPEARDPLISYFEALLSLEWPGRRIAVTPAPLPDGMAHLTRGEAAAVVMAVGAFDVTIGPLPEPTTDDSWAAFSITLGSKLRRRDWLGAAGLLLARAEEEMGAWLERKRSREARNA